MTAVSSQGAAHTITNNHSNASEAWMGENHELRYDIHAPKRGSDAASRSSEQQHSGFSRSRPRPERVYLEHVLEEARQTASPTSWPPRVAHVPDLHTRSDIPNIFDRKKLRSLQSQALLVFLLSDSSACQLDSPCTGRSLNRQQSSKRLHSRPTERQRTPRGGCTDMSPPEHA